MKEIIYEEQQDWTYPRHGLPPVPQSAEVDVYKRQELQGESNSISIQKQMLEDFARRNGLPNPTHFTDDGISGTRFDRPG